MVFRTYFDKNNTLLKNSTINTARNPVTELYYGGAVSDLEYSRFIFHFDESRLRGLYTGGTITDLSKTRHLLKMTKICLNYIIDKFMLIQNSPLVLVDVIYMDFSMLQIVLMTHRINFT